MKWNALSLTNDAVKPSSNRWKACIELDHDNVKIEIAKHSTNGSGENKRAKETDNNTIVKKIVIRFTL